MKDWSQMVKVPCPLALGTLLKKNLSPVKADEVPVWAHAFLGKHPSIMHTNSLCACVCALRQQKESGGITVRCCAHGSC